MAMGHDPDGLIAPFCGSAGGWLPLLCVMNLTGVTEEVVATSGVDHDRLTELAAATEPGCGGLLVVAVSAAASGYPILPNATGTLLGIRTGSLRPGSALPRGDRGHQSEPRVGSWIDCAGAGVEIGELRLVGGAARNDLWRQILADLCGVAVRRVEESESAALGAALQAMWAVMREGGHDYAIGSVVADHVRVADDVVVPGPGSEPYRSMRDRYAVALRTHHGVS